MKLKGNFIEMNNVVGSLWVFCNYPFSCVLVGKGTQHHTVLVHHSQIEVPLILSMVHAKCREQERASLWEGLLHDKEIGEIRGW